MTFDKQWNSRRTTVEVTPNFWDPNRCHCMPKVMVKVRILDIVSLRESSPQKPSGMARVLKGSHSFTCTPHNPHCVPNFKSVSAPMVAYRENCVLCVYKILCFDNERQKMFCLPLSKQRILENTEKILGKM